MSMSDHVRFLFTVKVFDIGEQAISVTFSQIFGILIHPKKEHYAAIASPKLHKKQHIPSEMSLSANLI